jgi:hypothetical protein
MRGFLDFVMGCVIGAAALFGIVIAAAFAFFLLEAVISP